MYASLKHIFSKHKTLLFSFIFFFAFSGIVSVFADENSGGYTPGESLNPTCAPNTTDCLVVISGGSPGGSDTYVQYNDNGAMAGDSNFIWDKINLVFQVGDLGGTVNNTAFTVDDSGKKITGYAPLGSITFGDNISGNGTTFVVNDDAQAITASVGGHTVVETAQFFGSGLDDMINGGTYTGTESVYYSITIDSEGTPDTFSWTDGTTTENNISITGSEQELSDGVTIAFASTTGHTSGDQWNFGAIAYASQLSINSKLAPTTNILGEDYPFVGSMIDDTANSGIGAITGILQTDEGPFILSSIIDQVNNTNSSLEQGTSEFDLSVSDDTFGSSDIELDASGSQSMIYLRSENTVANNSLTIVSNPDGNISEGSGILLSSSNSFDPVTGGYFGVVLGDFIRGSANDGYLSAGMAINTNDDSGNNLFLQVGDTVTFEVEESEQNGEKRTKAINVQRVAA